MKKLFLLYILLGLWIVALGDEHKYVSPTPVGELDSVIFLTFFCNKLPFTVLGRMVDHADIEIVNLAPFDKPHTHIGNFIGSNDTYLAINASLDSFQNVGTIIRNDSNSLVFGMELRTRLSKSGYGHQGESKYEKKPLHGANITNS